MSTFNRRLSAVAAVAAVAPAAWLSAHSPAPTHETAAGQTAAQAAAGQTGALAAAAAQQVTIGSLVTANQTTGLVRATGQVRPVPPNGTTVYLQRWDTVAKSWAMVGAGKTATGAVTVNGYRPGSVATYRLMVPARPSYGTGYSASRGLTHYVWRGAFTKNVVDWETEGSGRAQLVSPVRTRLTVRPSFWLKLRPDIAGCTRLSSRSENKATGTANFYVIVAPNNGQTKSTLLDQPGEVWTADVSLAGANDLLYQVSDNPNYGIDVQTDLSLLCSN